MKNIATIRRLASAALVTGVTSVALAAPASARVLPPYPDDGQVATDNGTQADPGWEFAQVATGAVGGIALVGAGAAATVLLRRHGRHTAHPA